MTKLAFKGSWNEITGKLKQKYAQLTDDDLLGQLQKKTGETKENLREAIART